MEKFQKSLKLNMILNAIKGMMGILFPLISFPYISRVLGTYNMGRWNFAYSIIGLLVLIASLGLPTYAIREGARIRGNRAEFEHFANQMFSINMIATMASYLILAVLLIVIPKLHGYEILLSILSLTIVLNTFGIEWIYSVFEDYAYITARSIAFQILSILLMFLFVHKPTDINAYAVINVVASAGSNILNYFHARKYIKVRFTLDTGWKKHIKPVMLLFAMAVTVSIYVSSDTTILGFVSGEYTVGIYSVSVKVYTIIKTILASVLVVSIPHLSAALGGRQKNIFHLVAADIYKTLLTVTLPAVTGIALLRREIIMIVAGKAYLQAVSSLLLLCIALVFCMGAYFWGQCILVPLKMESIVFKQTLLSAILNIVLNIILIPLWAENAAALTTILAEGLAFFLSARVGKKYVQMDGIGNTFLKTLAGCLAIIIVVLLFEPLKGSLLLYTAAVVSVSVAVYFLVEVLLNNEVITQPAKKAVNNIFRL